MAGKVLPAATAVWDMAEQLLTCVRLSLAETAEGSPAASFVVVGSEVPWDFCHCGGQLTVHVRTTYPSETFPVQKLEGDFTDGCPATWLVAEYVVTMLRCVPVQDNKGRPPAPEKQHEAARVDFVDRHAVRRGVVCCFEGENPL